LDFIGALLFYIFEFIGDLLTPSVGPTSVGNSNCGRDMRIFDRSLRGIRILRAMRLGAALVLSYLHWRAKPLGRPLCERPTQHDLPAPNRVRPGKVLNNTIPQSTGSFPGDIEAMIVRARIADIIGRPHFGR
jgi:hypothetical protein